MRPRPEKKPEKKNAPASGQEAGAFMFVSILSLKREELAPRGELARLLGDLAGDGDGVVQCV